MQNEVTTVIDTELCVGCGSCVEVCPARTLSLVDGKARVTGDRSLQCDHCAAVCPEGAIAVGAVDPGATRLATVENRPGWIGHGEYDAAGLVQLMRSRRSCRSYTDEPVAPEVLDDLVKIGAVAPSGTNSQLWTFNVLPDRPSVERLAGEVADFFRYLNALSEKRAARLVSQLIGNDVLGEYYREYHDTVAEALAEWDEQGVDRLFHGAPAAILIGMRRGASCPGEDALLASQNILLAAHAMGLGTCLIGFAVEAMKRRPPIKLALGIPSKERIYAVIALGHPAERYARLAGRRKPLVRLLGHAG
jgi:nitroreductase/Pyruvate/2-oxoacid:ferredoxin oxidoreductase delta subunit